MSKKNLKIAVIGAGAVAEIFHFPALTRIPGFDVKYIMDINEKRINRIKNIYGFHSIYTTSYDEIINDAKNLDGLLILTPPRFHKDFIIDAFENDLHVFCEKPLAMNVKETKEIIQKAEKADKILQVGLNMRFIPQFMKIFEMKNDKEVIGEEYSYSSTLFANAFQWPSVSKFIHNKQEGGGALFEMGVHHIDLLVWLNRMNIQLIETKLFFDKAGQIDTGAVLIFKNSEKGYSIVNIGWNNLSINEIIIYGNKGKLYANATKNEVLLYKEKLVAQPPIRIRTDVGRSPYARELLHFYNVIRGKEKLIFEYEEYLKVAEIIEQAYKKFNKNKDFLE